MNELKQTANVPPELYEAVLELALAITNARLAEDEILSAIHFEKLREFHDEQNASGNGHPFLTETLADYTEDAVVAIALYQSAIAQTTRFLGEPLHTKQISLAQRLIDTGNHEHAAAYLRDALRIAGQLGDSDASRECHELLSEIC